MAKCDIQNSLATSLCADGWEIAHKEDGFNPTDPIDRYDDVTQSTGYVYEERLAVAAEGSFAETAFDEDDWSKGGATMGRLGFMLMLFSVLGVFGGRAFGEDNHVEQNGLSNHMVPSNTGFVAEINVESNSAPLVGKIDQAQASGEDRFKGYLQVYRSQGFSPGADLKNNAVYQYLQKHSLQYINLLEEEYSSATTVQEQSTLLKLIRLGDDSREKCEFITAQIQTVVDGILVGAAEDSFLLSSLTNVVYHPYRPIIEFPELKAMIAYVQRTNVVDVMSFKNELSQAQLLLQKADDWLCSSPLSPREQNATHVRLLLTRIDRRLIEFYVDETSHKGKQAIVQHLLAEGPTRGGMIKFCSSPRFYLKEHAGEYRKELLQIFDDESDHFEKHEILRIFWNFEIDAGLEDALIERFDEESADPVIGEEMLYLLLWCGGEKSHKLFGEVVANGPVELRDAASKCLEKWDEIKVRQQK